MNFDLKDKKTQGILAVVVLAIIVGAWYFLK
jgi:hypothetical protein